MYTAAGWFRQTAQKRASRLVRSRLGVLCSWRLRLFNTTVNNGRPWPSALSGPSRGWWAGRCRLSLGTDGDYLFTVQARSEEEAPRKAVEFGHIRSQRSPHNLTFLSRYSRRLALGVLLYNAARKSSGPQSFGAVSPGILIICSKGAVFYISSTKAQTSHTVWNASNQDFIRHRYTKSLCSRQPIATTLLDLKSTSHRPAENNRYPHDRKMRSSLWAQAEANVEHEVIWPPNSK